MYVSLLTILILAVVSGTSKSIREYNDDRNLSRYVSINHAEYKDWYLYSLNFLFNIISICSILFLFQVFLISINQI